jgi:hypothetical protein
MVLSQEQLQRAFCDGAGKFIFAQLPLTSRNIDLVFRPPSRNKAVLQEKPLECSCQRKALGARCTS